MRTTTTRAHRARRAGLLAATATLAVTAGATATLPIGDQLRVSATGDPAAGTDRATAPAVAHDQVGDRFLVAWSATSGGGSPEIWGRLHRSDGTPVGDQFRISARAGANTTPAVAYDRRSGEYLVVWNGEATAGEREVFARRVTSGGALAGTEVRVTHVGPDGDPALDATGRPAIAYADASDRYMVAWAGDQSTPGDTEAWGQLLDRSGQPVGGAVRLSDMGAGGTSDPSIAYSPGTRAFLVAWRGVDDPAAPTDAQVYGQLVTADGAITGPDDARLSDLRPEADPAFRADPPAVAHNGRADEFMVAWQGSEAPASPGEREIFGQRVSATGAQLGADVRVSTMGPDGNPAFSATSPSVAAGHRSGEYLVTWAGDDAVAGHDEVFGQRLDAAGAEIGTDDFRVSTSGDPASALTGAALPAVAYGSAQNEYLVAWRGDTATAPFVAGHTEVFARRSGAGPAAAVAAPACAPVAPATASYGAPGRVRLSRTQLLINQRISQAAVNRANAIQVWLSARLRAGDFCGGALGQSDFAATVRLGFVPDTVVPVRATPRTLTIRATGGGNSSAVRLSRAQLLINQRISQAAVRRANALKARLDAGLTGGDVTDGALSDNVFPQGLAVLVASGSGAQAPSVTRIAPPKRGNPARVTLSARQLLINQRISQAAVRRTNALRARLATGLTGADVKDGTLGAQDLAAVLKP